MAIIRFLQYLEEQRTESSRTMVARPVSKAFEFSNDGFQIMIDISLEKQEQHAEAIQFLRRVADELSALERATR
jgi:hypothetical protein